MQAFLGRIGAFARGLHGWRALLFAWAIGFSTALAFAPFDIVIFLLLPLGLLVTMLDGAFARARPMRNSALIGWAFGFGMFVSGLYWDAYAFLVDPNAHAWQLPIAIPILTGGLALFPALAALVAGALWRNSLPRAFVFAIAFGLAEWLRGHVFTGFPWNIAAYAWGGSLAMLQATAVFGAYGLTFLTILFGAALAELFAERFRSALPVALGLLFACLWLGGELRLARDPTTTVAGVNVRIVQPNVPQNEKYKRPFVIRNWNRLLSLSIAPAKAPISILVWPEAAPPFLLMREPVALDEIARLTARGTTLITGAQRLDYDPAGKLRFFNSLYIFGRDARVLGVYDKFHLVPFGEYVPFAAILNKIGITKLTPGETGFSAGAGPHTYALPNAPPVGPLICYEILFPGAVVSEPRPSWLINVSDDSWFGPATSTGPYQHLLVARVRAIEEGLPVVRAANTGISTVIDPNGRTLATLPLEHMGVLDEPLPQARAPTPYARFGDVGFWLLIVLSGTIGWTLRGK